MRYYLIVAAKELGQRLPPLVTASDYIYTTPGTPEPPVSHLAPLVEWLYAQPWCDAVFSGQPGLENLPGALPLASLWNGVLNDRRPLLAVSPRWTHEVNEFGVPGTVSALTTQSALKSSHGSLSPYDMHALMIASGPSFHEAYVSDVPTGAADLAPTVLSLLGMTVPEPVDGRVLHEALRGDDTPPPPVSEVHLSPRVDLDRREPPRILLHRVGTSTHVHGSLHPQQPE